MKTIESLVHTWEKEPQAEVRVIVHVNGEPGRHVEALVECGMTVIRAFRLTNTIAALGPAGRVLNLLQKSWVDRIELDQTITTME